MCSLRSADVSLCRNPNADIAVACCTRFERALKEFTNWRDSAWKSVHSESSISDIAVPNHCVHWRRSATLGSAGLAICSRIFSFISVDCWIRSSKRWRQTLVHVFSLFALFFFFGISGSLHVPEDEEGDIESTLSSSYSSSSSFSCEASICSGCLSRILAMS